MAQLNSRSEKLGMILVDYLQLMRPEGKHNNREQEIREISGSLKFLAKELTVPVITLSQLRRSPTSTVPSSRASFGGDDEEPGTTRKTPRSIPQPTLSDLRESGSIEQDADLVFFIVRPEVDYPNVDEYRGKAQLIIAKHRNGPLGKVEMTFLGESTSFQPAAHIDQFNN
jgi:replicative DNA helicase